MYVVLRVGVFFIQIRCGWKGNKSVSMSVVFRVGVFSIQILPQGE